MSATTATVQSTTTPLIERDQRITPTRGIVATHTRSGSTFSYVDLKRCLRMSRLVHKCEKVDLLCVGAVHPQFDELQEYARTLDMRLSIRVSEDVTPPSNLATLLEAGLLDIYVNPATPGSNGLNGWLEAASAAGVSLRLRIAPAHAGDGVAQIARWHNYGVRMVNIAANDAFAPTAPATDSREAIGSTAGLATALESAGIEANIVGIPFCQFEECTFRNVANRAQFFMDHNQYHHASHDLALKFFDRASAFASKAILMTLAKHTFQRHRIDAWLLPWMIDNPWFYARVVAKHKIAGHLKWLRRSPDPEDTSKEAYERALKEVRAREARELGKECAACALHRICDRITPSVHEALPGIEASAIAGDHVVSAQHYCLNQPKYYDDVDTARLVQEEELEPLAHDANAILNNEEPDETVSPYHYTVEQAPYDQMEGGTRWHSVTNCEKLSSPITRLDPPFTVSVSFGGGIAEYVGFSFGRHCKLLCPMEGHKHEITLHVKEDGRYVLMRDGKPIRPSTFEGMHYVPTRLGNNLELRIACWNIDAFVVTQFVRIWRGEAALRHEHDTPPRFSALIVTTRYARRLQAVLRSLAHQANYDLSKVEIVVAYVPGLDGTEDLLDSISISYPELRIVRVPFAMDNASSKGFMINEAAQMATGEWCILLDSDIIVPPDLLEQIDANDEAGVMFMAPDGRKMLSRETTHRVLLGEYGPWDDWDGALRTAGEYRYREAKSVPIGYCQIVRRSCLLEIPYTELDHFEGADMWFGVQMIEKYGKEKRLSGMPVLHLDHGGSQWYGTTKHF